MDSTESAPGAARQAHVDRLLDALLAHVPFDGWSEAAFRHAEQDAGLPEGSAALAFPGGPRDAIDAYMARADREMVAEMRRRGVADMRIRDRIATAIRIRLEQAAPHRDAVSRALAHLSLTAEAGLGARSLWRTVDAIWREAGDTATDYNHYTKRLILSGVYSSTLLVWLQDDSEDFADSFAFLDRRIDNVMQFEKAKASWRKGNANLPSLSRFLGRLRYPAG